MKEMKASAPQSGFDRLREAMTDRVQKQELPGMVILVDRGEDVQVETIGAMAFESQDPMRRDTIFRITSMTKPILATAAMMLVEDGKLTLGEPVDRWLPELARRKVLKRIDGPLDDTVPAIRPITVEDLLTFRMGYGMLFEPTFEPPFPIIRRAAELQLVMGPPDPRTPHNPDEWIRHFGSLPLMYQPGERWQYNAGSLVLSVLVARASGQSLEDFLRTRIFEPLGMNETSFSVPAKDAGRLPGCYMTDFQTGKMELQTVSAPGEWTAPPAFPSGAAGLVSTIDNYLAFARLMLNKGIHRDKRLLTENSVALMTTNHLTPEQITRGGPILGGRGWGFGMAVAIAPDDVSAVPGRYGWDGGYGTSWFNHPHLSKVAIAMTQTSDFLFNGGAAEFGRLATGV